MSEHTSDKTGGSKASAPCAGSVCPKCHDEGWVWWNEPDDYGGPALETGQDDTRYSCDRCTPKRYQ
jgi:hypothetical protein